MRESKPTFPIMRISVNLDTPNRRASRMMYEEINVVAMLPTMGTNPNSASKPTVIVVPGTRTALSIVRAKASSRACVEAVSWGSARSSAVNAGKTLLRTVMRVPFNA